MSIHSTCATLGCVYRYVWVPVHCLARTNNLAQQCCVSFPNKCGYWQHTSIWEKIWWWSTCFISLPIYHWKHSGICVRGESASCVQVPCCSVTQQNTSARLQRPIHVRQSVPKMCCDSRGRKSTTTWSGANYTAPAQKDCKVSKTQQIRYIEFTLIKYAILACDFVL